MPVSTNRLKKYSGVHSIILVCRFKGSDTSPLGETCQCVKVCGALLNRAFILRRRLAFIVIMISGMTDSNFVLSTIPYQLLRTKFSIWRLPITSLVAKAPNCSQNVCATADAYSERGKCCPHNINILFPFNSSAKAFHFSFESVGITLSIFVTDGKAGTSNLYKAFSTG